MSTSAALRHAHPQPDVMITPIRGRQAERILEIVSRYPHVSGAEAAEVVNFLRRARYIEINQLTSDESVRRQLDRFMKGHRHELRLAPATLVMAFALVPIFVAICWLLWQPIG